MRKMYTKTAVLILVLTCFCGCQHSDQYVRRTELTEKLKRITQDSVTSTTLDRRMNASIEELKSAIQQSAQSVSTLESKLDTLATQSAESMSKLKADLQTAAGQNSNLIKHNTESISVLQSHVSDFEKQNAQLTGDIRIELEGLEKDISQLRLDVHQELSKQKTNLVNATDQLMKKTNQLTKSVNRLDQGLQRAFLMLGESRRSEDMSSIRQSPSEPTRMTDAKSSKPEYMVPFLTEIDLIGYWQQSPYRRTFAVFGPIVVLAGLLVAELYTRKHKKLAEFLMGRSM
jgi:hypothetical protein